MSDTSEFASRMRARFPEGLTGVFAAGGSRTTYLLDQQAEQPQPGVISDFDAYAKYGLDHLFEQMAMFYEMGGQNLISVIFSYRSLYERGDEYGEKAARMCLEVIDESRLDFYRDLEIDPYIAGIDTLLALPEDHYAHQVGAEFARFQSNWQYQAGRRKLIWEVAPIPLFSIWRAGETMGADAGAELEAALAQATDLRTMHDLLYQYYARAVYGTDLPVPHFYLGTNRNGDLKLRALLPIALLAGGPFRLYYTPYPSLNMTREAFQAMLEDLAFGKPLRSTKLDYSGQLTPELLQSESQRVQELSADPRSTLGLVRPVDARGQG